MRVAAACHRAARFAAATSYTPVLGAARDDRVAPLHKKTQKNNKKPPLPRWPSLAASKVEVQRLVVPAEGRNNIERAICKTTAEDQRA